MLNVSLFRDFIIVNQYSDDRPSQNVFSFRLPQSFWFDPKVQQAVLYKAFSSMEGISGLRLKSNENILPSSLSSDFSKYVLFSSNTSELCSKFTTVFDEVIERSFRGFEPFFDELKEDNYLYLDFDIDRTGFFCSTGTRRLGGYLDLSLQDFLDNELEGFFSLPFVCYDSQLMIRLIGMALSKIHKALRQKDFDTTNTKKMILGGAYGVYFDTLELKSLGNWKKLFDFDAIEKDLNYRIICKSLS